MSSQSSASESTAPGGIDHPAPARRAGWFAMLVIGSILAMLGGSVLGAAGAASVVLARADDGVLSTRAGHVSVQAFALTSPKIPLLWSSSAGSWPKVDVTLSAGSDGGQPVFVGIGPSADVASYLAGVHVAEVTGLRTAPLEFQTRDIAGSVQPEPPASQEFWVASASGAGLQQLSWRVEPGTWTVVIMNADASQGIDTAAAIGVLAPWAMPVVVGFIVGGLVLFLLGLVLILLGVVGWGRGQPITTEAIGGPYPAALTGEFGAAPSRGLWLVKWILLVPHWIVLAVLSVPFVVTTIVAGFAILFTGKYPRPLFAFNVGCLRWTWRASFYGYSALATDQYPPFSLQRANYPAEFDVSYPERLSHGLVLVKSWLLAIPHLLVLGVLTGGVASGLGWTQGSMYSTGAGFGLLGLLVLVAAVVLLFAGRYQRPLFDLIMGVNRWWFRVSAYVALMRDEYPPFRLDQGPSEPDLDAAAKK